jgi:hypothetical protein
MNCPHSTSLATKEQRKKTALGYRTFRCSICKRLFNGFCCKHAGALVIALSSKICNRKEKVVSLS